MLPRLDENGYLPPGSHECDWSEFCDRFGTNEYRRELLQGMRRALLDLKRAGCKRVIIGGSFVSDKTYPGDYDGMWEREGVRIEELNHVFRDVEDMRYGARLQKAMYLGELHPYHEAFERRFSLDRAGTRKGLVTLNLKEVSE